MHSMAKAWSLLLPLIILVFGAFVEGSHGSKLSQNYYKSTCPQVLSIVKAKTESTLKKKPRMGASLLRLHFHDCFVNGCDGSILLDDDSTFIGEKTALANNNSARGFELIDDIKAQVEKTCPGVVSCADILAIAARDSTVVLGGPSWKVKLGRRDSINASRADANKFIPAPSFTLSALESNFHAQGLSLKDLVALSGAHTIGLARCTTFRAHIYNDSNIDPSFAKSLQHKCPRTGKDNIHRRLDLRTPITFDNFYFRNLLKKKGLLRSDQELFNGKSADSLVKKYAADSSKFFKQFTKSMIKMSNIKPLTGNSGQIRINCRKAEVAAAIKNETRIGASLLRLHFHDCFVNGCDGSVLLDDNSTFIGEKTAVPNNNSARGFNVVDNIKARLEKACPGVVSCADILAIAARDSVVRLGGPSWKVRLGRRDSTSASISAANASIPPPTSNLSALISSFSAQGLSIKNLVALSGSHTIGLARCTSFRSHIYNDSNIDPSFANSLRRICPRSGNDSVLAPLDRQTPTCFDNLYYKNLLDKKGLLHSDQEIFNGSSLTDDLVKKYAADSSLLFKEFAKSMIKMGNIKPLTGNAGEIRINCRKAN
ncbi:Peroxidase 68 [Gossypium australe]|uniref:peroxidase n=1 Tax=Gossypium australe TaxID=47621 RepID=A0A5B6WKD3_9ROSI|nr:Peroxidase 68 [Gossypium australe]